MQLRTSGVTKMWILVGLIRKGGRSKLHPAIGVGDAWSFPTIQKHSSTTSYAPSA
jgi:hypothetical protein